MMSYRSRRNNKLKDHTYTVSSKRYETSKKPTTSNSIKIWPMMESVNKFFERGYDRLAKEITRNLFKNLKIPYSKLGKYLNLGREIQTI